MIKAVINQRTATDRKNTPRQQRRQGRKEQRTAEGRTARPKAQSAISERRRRSVDRLKRENPPTLFEIAEKPEDSHRGQADNDRKTARK